MMGSSGKTFLLATLVILGFARSALSQEASITPDGTLKTAVIKKMTEDRATYEITEGTINQSNLFHSFERFNLLQNENALFKGPDSISNIISRVTGGTRSSIFGTIRSDISGANLFLLNPSGFVFGPGASLDLSGSFHASTADYLTFDDGNIFYADPTMGSDVLTVAQPSAFGFLNENPAGVSILPNTTLSVRAEETLSLVGGDIDVFGANLEAPGGGINILSAGSSGKAVFSHPAEPPVLDSFERLGDINISHSDVSTSGDGGGKVVIRGGRLMVQDSSVFTDNFGGTDSQGVGMDIALRGTFDASSSYFRAAGAGSGRSGDVRISVPSAQIKDNTELRAYVYKASGDSGDIRIDSEELAVRHSLIRNYSYYGSGDAGDIQLTADNAIVDDAQIKAYTYRAAGDGGDVNILADSLNMDHEARITTYAYGGEGDAGDVNVQSDHLHMTNQSDMDTYTNWQGDSGNIHIQADTTLMEKGSYLLGYTSGYGLGGDIEIHGDTVDLNDAFIQAYTYESPAESGDIRISTRDLTLENGSYISGLTYDHPGYLYAADGRGGDVRIEAQNLTVKEDSDISAYSQGPGSGGDLIIDSGAVSMATSGDIAVKAFRAGDSGDFTLTADSVAMSGLNSPNPVTLGALVSGSASGHGGDFSLETNNLEIRDGAQLTTTTWGAGDAGKLDIRADDVLLAGRNELNAPAGIFARAYGTGSAGVLTIKDRAGASAAESRLNLRVQDGASISSSSFGAGRAGDVKIVADSLLLTPENNAGGSSMRSTGVYARGGEGDGGDVDIDAQSLSILDGAAISSSSKRTGAGGAIDIKADRILLSGTDPSAHRAMIASQSEKEASGPAGDVRISAGVLEVADGAQISVAALGPGRSGNLNIRADSIKIAGRQRGKSARLTASTESHAHGGDIRIVSEDLELTNGGIIQATTWGAGRGGTVDISSARVLVSGVDEKSIYPTAIQSDTRGPGPAGNIEIRSDQLEVRNGGDISASSFGSGRGGLIGVQADRIVLDGGHLLMSTGIYTNAEDMGDAGDINLEASAIEVLGGAQVAASTRGSGKGGYLKVKGGRILLRSTDSQISSGFYSRTESGGRGGDIRVTGESLKVLEGAVIDSSAFDAGDGGCIEIDMDSVLIARLSDTDLRPGVLANTVGTGDESGEAGDIRIRAEALEIRDSGLVDTRTLGPGSGGNIVIEVDGLDVATGGEIVSSSEGSGGAGAVKVRAAQSVTVDGSDSEGATGLFSTASGAGDAGSVTVEVPALLLTEGGEISTATSGTGRGGDIQLRVDTLRLVDKGAVSSESSGEGDGGTIRIRAEESFQSDTGAVTTEANKAQGGDITITAGEVRLFDGTRISAESSGQGDAGNINIDAGVSFASYDSSVSTKSKYADGGNIAVVSDYMNHLVNSEITASVGGGAQTIGGNIDIDPEYVVLENSRIVANAFEGRGGNIRIVADCFLADPGSVVDASSAQGIDGQVDIQAPVTNISGLIQPLSQDFQEALTMLREPCMARLHQGEYSSFLVTGRGGMPIQPGQPIPSFLGAGF